MNLYFNSELIFNDPFISYGYMNIFITDIVLIEDNSKINIDYQKAYKLLPSLLKGENLKLFREFCLHQIAKSDNNLANYYFNKYKDSYNDTLFIKVYANKYLINEKRKALASNKVELVDSDSKNITLDEVIKNYKDKTIYIDFWASWCTPCRNEMSKSKTLINEFKNVVFIYISIDSDKNEWMNASEEEKIEKNNNFLAINYPSSSFYKKLELQTIPRYLIYSKGKLVNENAPRPSSEKTKKLLNFYLN
ncbi:TlpA family protein disulfide reductase [Tenacibaculum gallaicum]|nr:TlpA disulfide reductase family protein [Tenacibaculum gallaicum]